MDRKNPKIDSAAKINYNTTENFRLVSQYKVINI